MNFTKLRITILVFFSLNIFATATDDLIMASFAGNVKKAKLAIKKGADINGAYKSLIETKTKENKFYLGYSAGSPPITIATGEGHIDIVKLLIAKKAKINKPSKKGSTALMVASGNNRLEIAKLLIENKVKVNQEVDCLDCPDIGTTALYRAAQAGNLEIAKILLDKSADINLKDESGDTALTTATNAGRVEIVKLLLEKKADTAIENNNKETAFAIATKNDNKEILDLLKPVEVEPKK